MRASSIVLAVVLGCASAVACGTGNDKDPAAAFTQSDAGDAGGLDLDGGAGGFDAGDPDVPYDPDAACAARSFGGAKVPLAVAIVFDVSGSMDEQGRMTTAQSGLKKAFSDTKFDDVAVTLFRFGLMTSDIFQGGCFTDKTPYFPPEALSTGRAGLFAKIDSLKATGSTPTYAGLNDAYAWLAPNVKTKTPPMDGKTAVILVTDGAPNCGSHTVDDFVALVKKGRAATMDTFIIGLPGSGAQLSDGTHSSVLLTKMAAAGTEISNLPAGCDANPTAPGATVPNPCYFDLQKDGLSADTLSTALDVIRKAASSCEYALPVGDTKYDLANPGVVVVAGSGTSTQVPRCADPAAPPATGCWVWADDAHTRVKVLGAACQSIKTDDAARVDILLQCRAT